jgi:hypothetical protein
MAYWIRHACDDYEPDFRNDECVQVLVDVTMTTKPCKFFPAEGGALGELVRLCAENGIVAEFYSEDFFLYAYFCISA